MNIQEEILCIGCGSRIQSDDPKGLGYLPSSVLKKSLEANEASDDDIEKQTAIYCQRCFRLRHYNEIADVELTDEDFRRILSSIADEDALVVNVVDIFDFNGSLIPNLSRFIGHNDLLMVANKRDVLPHSLKVGRMTAWLKEQAALNQLKPLDIKVISARREDDVRDLMEEIEHYRHGRDVYIVGVTNVGKSTLINAIIKIATEGEEENLITTSRFPGTTLDKIEVPLDEDSLLIDTPGIIQQGQMAHYLKSKELKYVSPQKQIKPKIYQLNPRQTLFFGALARFDFISGERQGVAAYFENNLMIHRTKFEGATDFYNRHAGELLKPAVEAVELVEHKFKVTAKTDLVVSGLGWISVAKPGEYAVWAPKGVEVLTRKALI